MSNKAGLNSGPHPQSQGRPRLRGAVCCKGLGLGALALGGSRLAQAAGNAAEPLATPQDERWQKQPFYGRHQAGVLTPQQAAMMLVAFDVLATSKADLERLFRLLTDRIAFLTHGGKAPEVDAKLPPLDSGIMGPEIYPDNLTITVSVGASLFDERFGLQAQNRCGCRR